MPFFMQKVTKYKHCLSVTLIFAVKHCLGDPSFRSVFLSRGKKREQNQHDYQINLYNFMLEK